MTSFNCITLRHVTRKENKQADALENLVSTLTKVPICQRWVLPSITSDWEVKEQVGMVFIYEIEKED
jgi:hypothetical protein